LAGGGGAAWVPAAVCAGAGGVGLVVAGDAGVDVSV